MTTPRYSAWHRPMLVCAGSMAVLAIVSAVGLLADGRMIAGAPAWLKPFKFAVSIAAYCLSWAWLVSLLDTRRRLAHRVSTGIVVVFTVEYAIIVAQVLRGTTSHFNVSTPVDSTLFEVMGVSIAALWTGSLVLTVLLVRAPLADQASRWAVRAGAVLSLAGLALGALMTMPTSGQRESMRTGTFEGVIGAHSVGVPDGGPGMTITGWSTTGGDLRIPHFVGMHALQALPLLVLALTVLARRWPRLRAPWVRGRIVLVASAAYTGLTGVVPWQALRGQPLLAPDALTLTSWVVLTGLAAGGIVWAVRRCGPHTTAGRGRSHRTGDAVTEAVTTVSARWTVCAVAPCHRAVPGQCRPPGGHRSACRSIRDSPGDTEAGTS